MTTKMGTKLFLMVTALMLMVIPMCSKGVKADETVGPRVVVAPSEQEKTILSTILKSFKNGHVDLTTLASVLNDPNIDRLIASLGKANLTKLANVLDEKPHVDLMKLVAALSDPELNLDDALRTFRDPKILPPTTLKGSIDASLMSTMKGMANQISDKLNDYYAGTAISPSDATNTEGEAAIKENIAKQDAELAKIIREVEEADGIPAGFERSTPNPNANTYGKSLMNGGKVTIGSGLDISTGTTDDSTDSQKTAEGSNQSTLNHKPIYVAIGVVFGLSMLTFLATRFVKAYCADTAEETRTSMRLTA